jgi:hypothetical protein
MRFCSLAAEICGAACAGPRAARLPVDAELNLGARSRSMPDDGKGGPGGVAAPPGSSSGGRAWAAGARP